MLLYCVTDCIIIFITIIIIVLQDFKNLGVRTASVNVIISSRVTSYCNLFIHEVPAISILMSGNVHHYNLPLDIDLIKGFLSSHFPSTIINEVR